jgi:hypothetical protein
MGGRLLRYREIEYGFGPETIARPKLTYVCHPFAPGISSPSRHLADPELHQPPYPKDGAPLPMLVPRIRFSPMTKLEGSPMICPHLLPMKPRYRICRKRRAP